MESKQARRRAKRHEAISSRASGRCIEVVSAENDQVIATAAINAIDVVTTVEAIGRVVTHDGLAALTGRDRDGSRAPQLNSLNVTEAGHAAARTDGVGALAGQFEQRGTTRTRGDDVRVITRTTREDRASRRTADTQRVRAALGPNHAADATRDDLVVPGPTPDDAAAGGLRNLIVARAAVQGEVASTAVDDVVSGPAVDDIEPALAVDAVSTRRGIDDIERASSELDHVVAAGGLHKFRRVGTVARE